MATTAHHIVSEYHPEDREKLEAETGQYDADADAADPWLTEKAFGANKRSTNPPLFVAATTSYDPWSVQGRVAGPNCSQSGSSISGRESEESVAQWYKSLARKSPDRMQLGSASASSLPTSSRPSQQIDKQPVGQNKPLKKDRESWFIARALESESAENSQPFTSPPPPPTLADILSRDPPPLPSQRPYTPPVWLAIGPGNKGFAMLQKSGWEEGEALGRNARSGLGFKGKEVIGRIARADAKKAKDEPVVIDLETELTGIEVVDLTLSSDEEDDNAFASASNARSGGGSSVVSDAANGSDDLDHNPRALLTPLPTILKSDRLGIGLKAKTAGPYRESVKRVTHSQAAIAANIKANEELKRMKKAVGRGKRGFEREKRKDEDRRKRMLAYMNAD